MFSCSAHALRRTAMFVTLVSAASWAMAAAPTRYTLDPAKSKLEYTWNPTGGKVNGNGATVSIDTAGLNAGNYMVNGHVSDGKKAIVDCSASLEPCPISIMAITAATPIKIPSVVKAERVLFRVSALRATASVRGKTWPIEARRVPCAGFASTLALVSPFTLLP